ncbi:MAG: DegT/DnrJ/EryC1/StrS family aminotransferase [Leptospirales bacterium]|nr:DegT/DnrJ/EryC1/StrS family aminotransferase [Leptospirales bacterium]
MIEYENLTKANAPFQAEYETAFSEFLKRGYYILGNSVSKFEAEFAQYCNTSHCVGVASGLDALVLGLAALDLPQGSQVIVPSNTYIATILAIVRNGLVPVLVEPDLRTYNINPDLIEKSITPATSAILVVHLYGKCCDMGPILATAKKHGLRVVEDCAQAHGARYKNQLAGSFGDIGAFSFYPTKNLGALGDAGAITTSQPDLSQKIAVMRNYGSRVKYYNEVVGWNSRLDEVQAALLSIKLRSLNAINDHKRTLARLYFSGLKDSFIKPVVEDGFHDVYHIFNVRHPRRDELREYLLKNEVKTEIHYPVSPVKQQAMRGIIDHLQTPIADEIHSTTLSLPISFFHTQEDIKHVIEIMNRFPE